jgi:hypothetical protein
MYCTTPPSRGDRFGLLPLLSADVADWVEGVPPTFPQRQYWATCRVHSRSPALFNLIELDLRRPREVQALTLSALSTDAALGLVAVSVEATGGDLAALDEQWRPPPELREPVTIVAFDTLGDLKGWTTQGEAFSVTASPRLFTDPSLNSLALKGEAATGKAVSPEFTLDQSVLTMQLHGGTAEADDGPGALCIRLIDTESGDTLKQANGPGSHVIREVRWRVDKWLGRRVQLELVDANANASFAWIGIRSVVMTSDQVAQ